MRVLVTGAAGFSGRNIARRLLAAGHGVVAHYRTAALPEDLGAAEAWQADLSADQALPPGLDAIVHAAAASPDTRAPGAAAIPTATLIRDNAVATARLAAADVGCFVYLSSLSVHGRVEVEQVTPLTPVGDPDPYGASKRLGEMAVGERARPAIALRLPAVIGRGAARNWPSQVVKRLRAGAAIPVFNPDSPFNNAVHVADLAAFIVRLIETPPDRFQALPVGSAAPITVRDAVATLAAALGLEARIEERQAARASFTIDWSAAAELGFAPRATVDALARYAAEEAG